MLYNIACLFRRKPGGSPTDVYKIAVIKTMKDRGNALWGILFEYKQLQTSSQ